MIPCLSALFIAQHKYHECVAVMALSRHLFRRLAVPNLSAVARFSTAKVGLLERLQNGTVIGGETGAGM